MRELVIVNASPLLPDSEVKAKVAPLQTQIDRDFYPAWHSRIEQVKVEFAGMADIPGLPADCWPIFLNRHSTDPGALGWHDDDPDQNIRTYSRVFAGDCIVFGLDWGVTLSHEALELILDPDIKRVFRMPHGRYAAFEACDAVEADELGYTIDGHRMSDFVLPAYFSTSRRGSYDFRNKLKAPCPALTPGGYMDVTNARGETTQVTADRGPDGLAGRRAILKGFRRQARARRTFDQLEVIA